MSVKITDLKKSEFYKELGRALETKKIIIDGAKRIAGSKVIAGKPVSIFELYLSDGQVVTIYTNKNDYTIEHIEVDGLTFKDFEARKAKEENLARKLSAYIAKRSKVKLKREILKKVDIKNLPKNEVKDKLLEEKSQLEKEIEELENKIKEIQ